MNTNSRCRGASATASVFPVHPTAPDDPRWWAHPQPKSPGTASAVARPAAYPKGELSRGHARSWRSDLFHLSIESHNVPVSCQRQWPCVRIIIVAQHLGEESNDLG